MWQCEYAKEPFDLKLFVLRCMRGVKWILLACVLGAVCIGGIYYLRNVTFGGKIPYMVTQKLDVEYAKDPDTQTVYSYYVAYTWNDWLKSDVFMEGLLQKLPDGMTKEELINYYEMTLPADTRNPYLIVTHPKQDMAVQLSEILKAQLAVFAQNQKEIASIEVIDTIGPALEVRDIRTFRAVILGAVVGTFFALFGMAFKWILDGGIFVPETFTYRYQIPVVGYLDEEGDPSEDVKVAIQYLFREKKRVGITAVEPELDLTGAKAFFGENQAVCIPSVLQVPEGLQLLRENDGNLLLVQAGIGNGKAIESVLHLCGIHDVPVTAVLLVGADRKLINQYRFNIHDRKKVFDFCKRGKMDRC